MMKKALVVALAIAVVVSVLPMAALAGDPHAVRNRWAGAAIGAATVVAGSLLLNALLQPAPVVAAPAPVVPPPIVYQAPPVVYVQPMPPPPPPVVVYRTLPPVVVYRAVPPGHWTTWKHRPQPDRWYHQRHWD
jgi:hypothetical protein